MIAAVILVIGLVVLAVAADQFVVGAARIAVLRSLPPIVVGAVIVGFGTSAPELLVSAIAAAQGSVDIAVGNIVGSNVANLTLLLGIGAAITAVSVASTVVRREAPIVLAVMVIFSLTVLGGIGRVEGALLLVLLGLAISAILRRGTTSGDPLGADTLDLVDAEAHRIGVESIRTVLGLLGTIAGAQAVLWGAVEIATRAGWDEGFVGATVVAVGTSLPELTTVVQSARRSETDLLVGNLLGSNLFNALGVGGVVGLIGTGPLGSSAFPASLAAVAAAAIAWLAMRTGRTVRRWEGLALIGAYAAMVPLFG